jgi:predicted ABC-type ATPase
MGELAELTDHLAHRPLLLVLGGSNGAGKTTFYEAHLRSAALRFINADIIGREARLGEEQAALAADALRSALIAAGESFITETVFSDPVGAKLRMFQEAMERGYRVVLIFIGIGSADRSDERVAMRVSQGGHDVPADRIQKRYPRTLRNLAAATRALSAVLVYDNDDIAHPYRRIGLVVDGKLRFVDSASPAWWKTIAEAL